MRKALLIIFAVAILGVLATFNFSKNKLKTAAIGIVSQSTTGASQQVSKPSTPVQSTTNAMMSSMSYKNGTYTGSLETNPFENVQVTMFVSSGKITDITFATLTADSNRSDRIVSQAVPMLKNQTLSAQSAKIDGVSGATYISQSYETSLQAAIDKAAM